MTFKIDEVTANQIRSELSRGEKDLPESVLKTIYEKKLFRLFLPAELDGLELSLPDALRVIRRCSYVDGDFGWQINIGSGGGYFAGYIDPEVVQERFSRKEFVIAGSGIPAGTLRKSGDGYIVNGSWKYCSGCTYATLFTFTCVTDDGKLKAVALDPDQVQINEDWDAYGLTATTSHSVVVESAQISEEMIFDVTRKLEGWGYPLYDYPFLEFARTSFFATVSGYFSHLLDELEAYSSAIAESQKEKHFFLNRLIGTHREWFNREMEDYEAAVEKSWGELVETGQIEEETLKRVNTYVLDLSHRVHEAAAELLFYTGMTGVRTSSSINKVWRDLSTASQHVFLKEYSQE